MIGYRLAILVKMSGLSRRALIDLRGGRSSGGLRIYQLLASSANAARINRVAVFRYLYLILPVGLPVLLATECDRLLSNRLSWISLTKAKIAGYVVLNRTLVRIDPMLPSV